MNKPGHQPTSADLSSGLPARFQKRLTAAFYQRIARQLLEAHDVNAHSPNSTITIVECGSTPRELSFLVALDKPDSRDLDRHFKSFVLAYASQDSERSVS